MTGASSGIGEEIAGQLASRGLGVTLVARTESRLRELAERLAAAHGVRAEWIVCDLTDEAERASLPARIAEQRPRGQRAGQQRRLLDGGSGPPVRSHP